MSGPAALPDADPLAFYRAEWLPPEALFAWFKRPAYFPELEAPTPCILVGGRGTGKTTVLRCLSYQGRAALNVGTSADAASWRYYGFYHRVNTNRVRAFHGGGLSEQEWTPLFSHYVNLLLIGQFSEFLLWYETADGRPLVFDPEFFENLSESLRTPTAPSLRALRREVEKSLLSFENFLNDLDAAERPRLSVQGGPIDLIAKMITEHPAFQGKHFFFILDEFENLLDYQQVVFNTLVKHSNSNYSFKIGVRELGWRTKRTLNSEESLSSPADYALIDITKAFDGDAFSVFAEDVCNYRLERGRSEQSVSKLFPGLSVDEEATRLGVSRLASPIRASYIGRFADTVASMRPLELVYLDVWARQNNVTLETALQQRESEIRRWQINYQNYAYSLLFSIRKGRPGIRKYYAGWRTLALMSGGNIRFMIELVYQARTLHFRAGGGRDDPISPEHQTDAAIAVGQKYIEELPGTSVLGGQLTKLLLGLGRVFEVMASQPEGHTPEVTQFHLEDDSPPQLLQDLLDTAVMNLALVRSTANKRAAFSPETKDYDYAVHPIYAAFFGFSYRRKRKMKLRSADLLALIEAPAKGISRLLAEQNRGEAGALPSQLQLFSGFYGDA